MKKDEELLGQEALDKDMKDATVLETKINGRLETLQRAMVRGASKIEIRRLVNKLQEFISGYLDKKYGVITQGFAKNYLEQMQTARGITQFNKRSKV